MDGPGSVYRALSAGFVDVCSGGTGRSGRYCFGYGGCTDLYGRFGDKQRFHSQRQRRNDGPADRAVCLLAFCNKEVAAWVIASDNEGPVFRPGSFLGGMAALRQCSMLVKRGYSA